MSQCRICSRCRERPTPGAMSAYCRPCRAAYQREWRLRRLAEPPAPAASAPPRPRLRGTPTLEEMIRFRLI